MKNILLAVTGLSPQVITETLYALHQNSQSIDAIHIITTRTGKEKIYAELTDNGRGYFYRYLNEYNIDSASIDFSYKNIHVIKDSHGNEIPDIISEADNEKLLKKCLDLTFHFTNNPDTAVFFSIAGGRKTMSSCLTLAAQMYGRPQDRLYHVLVSPEFESTRNFYYPPKKSQQIELADMQGHPFLKETRFAQINLIPVPFVSIRDNLAPDLLAEPMDPATLMLSIIKEKRSNLTVNLISKKIIYKKAECDMMPARLALYAFFAMQKKNCTKKIDECGNCIDCFIDIQTVFEKQNQITELYCKICGPRPIEEMSNTGIVKLDSDNFNTYKSRIKTDLMSSFGLYALKNLEILSTGTRPNTRYGIAMDKNRIEIVY
ncbi:MAG: CRISPR-associated ring nuclease Csm6 [Desulfobacterales bacterium]|nr:CRISPR-associated ring nuclease Csm6 [Desulfobacterales bacterium]